MKKWKPLSRRYKKKKHTFDHRWGDLKSKKSTTHCPLCHSKFNSSNRFATYNHNHNNGLFYSILCIQCNILCIKQALVVRSHSFGDNDGPEILRSLKSEWTRKLKMIAKDDDSINSMIWEGIKFMDSSKLLAAGIEKLSSRLSECPFECLDATQCKINLTQTHILVLMKLKLLFK